MPKKLRQLAEPPKKNRPQLGSVPSYITKNSFSNKDVFLLFFFSPNCPSSASSLSFIFSGMFEKVHPTNFWCSHFSPMPHSVLMAEDRTDKTTSDNIHPPFRGGLMDHVMAAPRLCRCSSSKAGCSFKTGIRHFCQWGSERLLKWLSSHLDLQRQVYWASSA